MFKSFVFLFSGTTIQLCNVDCCAVFLSIKRQAIWPNFDFTVLWNETMEKTPNCLVYVAEHLQDGLNTYVHSFDLIAAFLFC